MEISVKLMKTLEELEPKVRRAFVEFIEEFGKLQNQRVTKKEFNELKEVVKELVEAQKRTEKRVGELAEAQKNTEIRMGQLEARMEELVEAQRRTEARVEELAEAQKRTEARVEELAEAQKRTEEELFKLIEEHRETRRQLGGLSQTLGYVLENEAIKNLPGLLKNDFGISVKEGLKRTYVKDNEGKMIEINIIGEGKKNGKKIVIIGESKSQLSKRNIDEFIKKKLKRLEGVYKEIFPVLITHMVSQPDVEKYATKKGIKIYYSYQF